VLGNTLRQRATQPEPAAANGFARAAVTVSVKNRLRERAIRSSGMHPEKPVLVPTNARLKLPHQRDSRVNDAFGLFEA
jgi:hypothetical protein